MIGITDFNSESPGGANLIGGNFESGIQIIGTPLNDHPIDESKSLALQTATFANNATIFELIPTIIAGNSIGINGSGDLLPNDNDGVFLHDARALVVSNVVAANKKNGVHIQGNPTFGFPNAINSLVLGNKIGTLANGTVTTDSETGQVDQGNGGDGVLIEGDVIDGVPYNGAQYNIVGAVPGSSRSDAEASRNIISGNGGWGVHVSGIGIFHDAPPLTDSDGGVHGDPFPYPSGLAHVYGTVWNTISGNYIGTDSTGSSPAPNIDGGVLIDDAAEFTIIGNIEADLQHQWFGNVISGNGLQSATNAPGVEITGPKTAVAVVGADFIGLTAAGDAALANHGPGVLISNGAIENNVGGDTYMANLGARNYIAGNDGPGVEIENCYDLLRADENGNPKSSLTANWPAEMQKGTNFFGNNIVGNWIGLGVQISYDEDGTPVTFTPIPIGNKGDGILIHNSSNTRIGGALPMWTRNIVSANGDASHPGNGIHITGSKSFLNFVEQDFIGTDPTGTAISDGTLSYGNAGDGVRIDGDSTSGYANHNLINGTGLGFNLFKHTIDQGIASGDIGGAREETVLDAFSEADMGNVISGNVNGVQIAGGASNIIAGGNFIGTDFGGANALPNSQNGVLITNGATYNEITAGVRYTSQDVPVDFDDPDGPKQRVLWGEAVVQPVISGNAASGVTIQGAGTAYNIISGALIGTTGDGTGRLGNVGDGVLIQSGANTNAIQSTVLSVPEELPPDTPPSEQVVTSVKKTNTISANGTTEAPKAGVHISGSTTHDNVVYSSFIGTNEQGDSGLGNTDDGVLIDSGAYSNKIGNDNFSDSNAATSGNIIVGNRRFGVSIQGTGTNSNAVAQNRIGLNQTFASIANGTTGGSGGGVEIADGPKETNVTVNWIAANTGPGILVDGGDGLFDDDSENKLIVNWIGVKPDPSVPSHYIAAANTDNEVFIRSSSGTWLQGSVIGGSPQNGVQISSSYETVLFLNFIGIGPSGENVANTGNGVLVDGCPFRQPHLRFDGVPRQAGVIH
jgi:hypothetical protein